MSVEEHRAHATKKSGMIEVIVVSSTRDASTDTSGKLIEELVRAAGHDMLECRFVQDDVQAIQKQLRASIAQGADAIVFTGGTGVSGKDVTPEALSPMVTRTLPGFGELFRHLSYAEIGSAAWLSRAFAGTVGQTLVVAIPGSKAACRLAMEKLVIPELPHFIGQATKAEPPSLPAATAATAAEESSEESSEEGEAIDLPEPSGTFGQLGRTRVQVSSEEGAEASESESTDDSIGLHGWKRVVHDIGAELEIGGWPTVPEDLEKVAPVMNVLERAGEKGTLTLASGRVFSLFAWPDLSSDRSKVIAIAPGSPLPEILALHRYPSQTGTCIDGKLGFAPSRQDSVPWTCESVVSFPPADGSGELFAVQGDAAYIQRGNRIFKWDGKRETDCGTNKQTLATLVLDWSRR